jgi:hypothetical protein
VCVCVCVCVYACMHVHARVCACICVRVYIYIEYTHYFAVLCLGTVGIKGGISRVKKSNSI